MARGLEPSGFLPARPKPFIRPAGAEWTIIEAPGSPVPLTITQMSIQTVE